MRPYELMLVLRPDLGDDGVAATVAQVSEVIAGENGELVSAGQLADKKGNVVSGDAGWKTRRLAYTIGNHREGYYVVLQFMAPPTSVSEVERVLNLREEVLRHLVVRLEELTEVRPAPEPPPARGKARESAAPAAAPPPAEAPATDAAAMAGAGEAPTEQDTAAAAPAPVEDADGRGPTSEADPSGADPGEAAEASPGSEEEQPAASEGPEEAP